jgi:hypothetical protein
MGFPCFFYFIFYLNNQNLLYFGSKFGSNLVLNLLCVGFCVGFCDNTGEEIGLWLWIGQVQS